MLALDIHEKPVEIDENKLIDRQAAYGFVVNNGQVLVVDTRSVNGKYWLVGGYREGGESPEEAFIREAQEETGKVVSIIALIFSHDYIFSHPNGEAYHCKADFFIAKPVENIEVSPLESTPTQWLSIMECNPNVFHVLIQDAVKQFLDIMVDD